MEAEAAKLREMTAASDAKQAAGATAGNGDVDMNDEDKEAVDSRSVYVGNVSSSLSRSRRFFAHLALLGSLGRLRFYTRGDSNTFRFLWYHQPCDHPLRQVHRSQRVSFGVGALLKRTLTFCITATPTSSSLSLRWSPTLSY